jgi:hypothetical protein
MALPLAAIRESGRTARRRVRMNFFLAGYIVMRAWSTASPCQREVLTAYRSEGVWMGWLRK